MSPSLVPLGQRDLQFSSASTNITSIARQINHSTSAHSISARLRSISDDASYVRDIAKRLRYPVVTNERCGSWYVPPDIKAGSAYFKSTDGHAGQWSFSLRRLNLQLLPLIGEKGGCVIVDSTRRGKYVPDALSKTVSIWCSVLNRLLFPEMCDTHTLVVHPRLVNASETAQIEARLDDFVESAKKLQLDLEGLRRSLKKPTRPFWVSRSLSDPSKSPPGKSDSESDTNTVYLCMASQYQESSIVESATGYVQGAGDDNEGWSRGLTPTIFWDFRAELRNTAEGDLPDLIDRLVSKDTLRCNDPFSPQLLMPYSRLSVARVPRDVLSLKAYTKVIVCAPIVTPAIKGQLGTKLVHMRCREGKLGSRDLRNELPKLTLAIQIMESNETILLCCPTGKDLAVGVALAIICLYGDEAENISASQTSEKIDKALIKRKLATIMAAMPTAAPSRATLNAVNSFLMKEPT